MSQNSKTQKGNGVKERPILFSGPMVRAILDGRKSQTRRAPKIQPTQLVYLSNGQTVSEAPYWTWRINKKHKCLGTTEDILRNEILDACPYGQPGDRLWVRETFATGYGGVFYRASEGDERKVISGAIVPWKPSIHMPRKLSRITLEIVTVRVERLQDITEEDAKAEGVVPLIGNWKDPKEKIHGWTPHVLEYSVLWDSINGLGAWDANPWVWVIEFRRINP